MCLALRIDFHMHKIIRLIGARIIIPDGMIHKLCRGISHFALFVADTRLSGILCVNASAPIACMNAFWTASPAQDAVLPTAYLALVWLSFGSPHKTCEDDQSSVEARAPHRCYRHSYWNLKHVVKMRLEKEYRLLTITKAITPYQVLRLFVGTELIFGEIATSPTYPVHAI